MALVAGNRMKFVALAVMVVGALATMGTMRGCEEKIAADIAPVKIAGKQFYLEIVADEGETESAFYPTGKAITLERYIRGTFDKLSTVGAREADHPLSRRGNWPRRFAGSWVEFSTFPTPIDIRTPLRTKRMMLVSRWNSATIDQHFIRYNFKPKLEWPE